ncbi:class I SAM-dependent methyltransferase [Paenibacillus agricola]|uniref:Class I SAM-dependent methyltransferase n=1 Tax=Paenibacillus agricola TaxID=2716264 RepID=A0ABX0J541_9BACL|nr:class I SAM-dependent methyltransferase [Paenibacillus agricola]NHN30768.1 class I SAM-dependent methyltransferase [Paenibacillus agricola]
MLITTSYDPQPEQWEAALALSGQLKQLDGSQMAVRLVERKQFSLPRLRQRYSDSDIMLVSRERIEYYQEHQPVLFFHPSTAAIRIKRLINGEHDPLMELSAIQAGDRILDCTAGLGSDALVYSFATQGNGQVTALESRIIPYLVLKHGLGMYHSEVPGMDEAMRRIEVVQADHYDYLQKQPDNSYDIVYLDPMFRKPIHESSSISAIRFLADPRAVTELTILEARRVAKRVIILKEHRDSGEFARLGFAAVKRSTTKIAYGVITL